MCNSNKKFALNQKWVILVTNNFTIVQYKDIAIFHVNRSLEDKILHFLSTTLDDYEHKMFGEYHYLKKYQNTCFPDLGVIYCLLSCDREESRQYITRLINSYI